MLNFTVNVLLTAALFFLGTVRGDTPCVQCPAEDLWGDEKCIDEIFLCDGYNDCSNGADEDKAICPEYNCMYSDIKCADGHQCKSHDFDTCNLAEGCRFGTDEYRERCEARPCNLGRTKCNDKIQCIGSLSFCDGKIYCRDGSDEGGEFCREYTCKSGFTKCRDGLQCIQIKYRCDTIVQCNDESDEQGCADYDCRELNDLYGWKCDNGIQCVSQVCDGEPHCLDGSDEKPSFCQNYTCTSWDRKCADGKQCVWKLGFCDGTVDCLDGSDEANCQG